jgi:hypothetical protein
MNKPILFLTSSNFLQLENLYFLKDLGRVLNFSDKKHKDGDIQNYAQYQFIICNMKEEDEVSKLRFIEMIHVTRVAIVRKGESVDETWVKRLNPDYTIKDFDFVKQVSNSLELLNYIKHLSMFKKPDGNVIFYGKKAWSFLTACFSKGNN